MKDKPIGEIIKNRRIELGLTQEQLADRLGYKSKSTINKIELGINDVSQKKIVKLAEALDTTTAYLMGWVDNPKRRAPDKMYGLETPFDLQFHDEKMTRKLEYISDEEAEIIFKFRMMTDSEKKLIKKMLEINDTDFHEGVEYYLA